MIDQNIIELYDTYSRQEMSRRQFMDKLARLAGGVAAAYSLLPLLENNYALAAVIDANDTRLTTGKATFPAPAGDIQGYQAAPKTAGPLPAVLVIHENKGLNPHIEDIVRRLAVEGFLALAPDALTAKGGTPADPEVAATMIKELAKEETEANFQAAALYLQTNPRSTGKVGVVGFCWGGAMANQLAVRSSEVSAVVSYYGRQPRSEDVPKIKVPLLLHYAGLDQRINEGIPDFTRALDSSNVRYTLHMYDGANHAFNNDTNSARYNEEAAKLAWQRTISFFNTHLKS